MAIKGNIGKVLPNVIWGFAFNDKRSTPIPVSLYINDEKVATTKADQFRQGILDKGIHPTGRCGFVFYMKKHKLFIPDKAKIQVKAGAIQKELNNSPYYFSANDHKEEQIADSDTVSVQSSLHHKILIVGIPKSGTSILTYRIAAGLKDPFICFEPGEEDTLYDVLIHKQVVERPQHLVTKSLYIPDARHRINLISSLYSKKIWIYRDIRDRMISGFFYVWYRRILDSEDKFKQTYQAVLRKESDPQSIPFHTIMIQPDIQKLSSMAAATMNAVKNLDSSWHLISYEDLIKENTEELNQYLGFEVKHAAEVANRFGRVVRSKSYDNWRKWFTQEDVDFFRPLVSDYLAFFGYDTEDWTLNPVTKLPATEGSNYLRKLAISRLKLTGRPIPSYLN